ncbi:MAG TPA: prolyl oligopeptidase family serine peptidase [Dehalococcoidia bacterium]|nr:prolyl oligopeptidase family serine peptidase [Dehalococcoidia bacterium]
MLPTRRVQLVIRCSTRWLLSITLPAAVLLTFACAMPVRPTERAPFAGQGERLSTISGQPAPTPAVTSSPPTPQRVTFQNGDLTLVGYLFHPDGAGPFPAIIWNHGSEQNPTMAEFQNVANIFVPAGYAVLAPERRGQGESQGQYIGDAQRQALQQSGADAEQRLVVQLLSGAQLDDQLAGLSYLESLPYVDQSRLAVVGCSYGGIETLFAAERGAGFKAAVALSPAAESWDGNASLRARLVQAADNVNIPIFLIHPEKDVSVAPGYAIAQELQKDGKPYKFTIYPPFGTDVQNGHCFGGADRIWGRDAVQFLNQVLGVTSP